jgi:hypothetical protein
LPGHGENVHFAISALVDQLADRLQVGIAVCDERLDNAKHFDGRLGEADEDSIVDLKESQQLQRLPLLGINLVDTLDADDEGKLRLSGNVERSLRLGNPSQANLLSLLVVVLLHVLLGTLEDGFALLLVGLQIAGQHSVAKNLDW